MNTELTILDVNDFKNANTKSIEALTNTLHKLALDAVLCNKTTSLKSSFKSICGSFEKISNCLELDKSSNMTCYYFGKISSITTFILDVISDEALSDQLENISKSYTLLVPALEIIKKYNTISGVDLQKELNMKASSNLSNFLRRIDKYDLINIRKIGTTNYISLTLRGDRLLSKKKKLTSDIDDTSISLTQLYNLLDCLSDELLNANPSSIKVMNNSCTSGIGTKEKRLLKHKIDCIFGNRDKYVRLKLKAIKYTSTWDSFEPEIFFDDEKNTNDSVYEIDLY